MSIDKLPSGSYRIRKMYKGTMYTVTTDTKPSKSLADKLIMEKAMEITPALIKGENMTFQEACEQYVSIKSNVLSPSTLSEYENMITRFSESLRKTRLNELTQAKIQAEINQMSIGRSPKTIRNRHGFISSVLKLYAPNIEIHTTMPPKEKKEPYIPNNDDVKKVLDKAKGTRYEVPIRLAMYSLRRSEICALTLDDIDGNVVTINKAKVYSKDSNGYVIKNYGKTYQSNRQIVIDDKLVELIQNQGYVYKGQISAISQYLKKIELELGIEKFTPHKFRHYFASEMSGVIPDADLLKMGGWQTDQVMKTVYRHSMNTKNLEAQKMVAERLKNLTN